MGNMFNNYPQPEGYVPNNRKKPICNHGLNIMVGETSSHTFEIPGINVKFDCNLVKVMYKVGLEVVITKDIDPISEDVDSYNVTNHYGNDFIVSSITDHISPEETLKFKDTLLDTTVQLKLFKNDGDIVYSEIYDVTIVDSLDEGSN